MYEVTENLCYSSFSLSLSFAPSPCLSFSLCLSSREAPVDNECLSKCRQVGGSGESWNMSYWQLG